MTSIAAIIALSNATGDGTAMGAKGGHTSLNGTHGNGTYLTSTHASGKNTSRIARRRLKNSGLFNPNHPSAPGNSSSVRSRNNREFATGHPAPRHRRQAATGTFVGCSPRFATSYQQKVTIDFSQEAPQPFQPVAVAQLLSEADIPVTPSGWKTCISSHRGEPACLGATRGANIQLNSV